MNLYRHHAHDAGFFFIENCYHYYMKFKLTKGEFSAALIIGILFIASAYYSDVYKENIQELVSMNGIWGMFLYVAVSFIAVVVAPVSAMPLLPIAAAIWGPFTAGVLSLFAWTLGAMFAFWISRKFGYEFVGKFVKLKRVQLYADKISNMHLFWTVVLLRIVLPVDVLSYALGLFSKMNLGLYTLATIIGIAPFAFIFSYASNMPIIFQIMVLAIAGVLLFFGYEKIREDVTDGSKA